MSRYVKLDSIDNIKKEIFMPDDYAIGFNDAIDHIKEMPTADVEEVVRCRFCKHKRVVDMCMVCDVSELITLPDGYCWRGEKE